MPAKKVHSSSSKTMLTAWDVSFVFMFFFTLVVLLFTELKSVPWKMLTNLANIFITWIVFFHTSDFFKEKTRKLWPLLVGVSVVLIVIYTLFHFINVYELGNYSIIKQLCSQQASLCGGATSLFYITRLYRFITLSFSFLLTLLLLMLGIHYIAKHYDDHINYLNWFKTQPLFSTVCIGILLILFQQLLMTGEVIFTMSFKSWDNRNVEFLDRFVAYEYGTEHHGWIWEYGKFLNAHTPESAVLFLPPQSDIWAQEGNKYYFRWFVYPRTFTQSTDPWATIPEGSEYVLISKGGWVGGENGWPKRAVKPECVAEAYLYDRTTLEQRPVSASELKTALQPTEWGIVKLNPGDTATCL